jgi:hypothetical protein
MARLARAFSRRSVFTVAGASEVAERIPPQSDLPDRHFRDSQWLFDSQLVSDANRQAWLAATWRVSDGSAGTC